MDDKGLQAAIATLPNNSGTYIYRVIDVRKSDSVDNWIKDTVQTFGKLDGAVNMAGVITKATPITELSDDEWNFSFDVNVRGVMACLRAQLKAMTKGGSIVSHPCLTHEYGRTQRVS